jgi:hypothetical protein
MRGVVGARASNDRDGDCLGDCREQTEAFVVGKYGRLARGASNNKAIVAVVLQPFGQALGAIQVE